MKLLRNPVDAIYLIFEVRFKPFRRDGVRGGTYRINKENQDENKCNFHSILQFGHKSTLGDKTKYPLSPGKGEGKDQEHKDAHLRQEQEKHL